MTAYFNQAEKITVEGSSTATFTLAANVPLERLTVWCVSNTRTIVDLTLQPQINGADFGAPTNIVGAVAADLVYNSGSAAHENAIIPVRPNGSTIDPFVFSVLLTNNDSADCIVTMYATANQHT